MRRPSVRAPQPVLELPPCADRLGQGFWEAQLGWRQSRSPHLAMDRLAVTWRGHWSRDSLRRLEKPVLESRRDHSTCLARPVAAGLQSLPGRGHEAGGSGRSNLERLRRTSAQDGSYGRAQPRNSDSARGEQSRRLGRSSRTGGRACQQPVRNCFANPGGRVASLDPAR